MPPKKIKIPPISLVIKAEANRQQLVHWLQASDEDFAKYEHCSVSSKKRKSVLSVLVISAEEVETLDTRMRLGASSLPSWPSSANTLSRRTG